MSLSTRVSLQWPPNEPEELSNTLVMNSKSGRFVDIRIFRQYYPLSEKDATKPIDELFQWCMCGIEEPLGGGTINFKKDLDHVAVSEALAAGTPPDQIDILGAPDIGHFSSIEGSENRKETGSMISPETGKEEEYIEIWKSLDPIAHNPTEDVREKEAYLCKATVLKVSNPTYEGKLMKLGNWLQGLLYTKLTCKFSVIRSHYDGKWNDLIKYGDKSFPTELPSKVGDTIEYDGVKWECLEV